ncbi:hypothetical protein BDY19DRAFT_380835 [Irpex rosettiformis]|uniref:Uncharacterized protein n=1 Tax=Irpex rosettiformis TaxID=378272 RepID=A0ACB8TWE8_9APHY|nr:hypothetical protein BDY19DRAFT_380835 [Irpex rosettiformis]
MPFNDISDSELPSPVKRTPAPKLPVDRISTVKQRRKRKRSSTSSSTLQTSPEQSLQSLVIASRAHRIPSDPPRRTARAASTSKERTLSDSEPDSSNSTRGRREKLPSRSRSSARSSDGMPLPSAPLPYPPLFPLYPPSTHGRVSHQRHPQPLPPPPIQDPQAQYGFMQAVQYLSYYLSGSAGQPPQPPTPYTYPPAWPQTPRRRSRGRTRDESSSPARASTSEIPYRHSSPDRHYLHYDVGYSSGTSPPMSSSPIPSSPAASYRHPILAAPKRSKSRGRRVSFKLDPDDETHSRYERYAGPAEPRGENSSVRGTHSSGHRLSQKPYPNSEYSPANDPTSEEESSSRRRSERGRTPGPSSRHTRSGSAR